MSLINDALKKAQAGGNAPGPDSGGQPPPRERPKPPSVKSILAQALVMAGIVLILTAVAVVIIVTVLRKPQAAPSPATPSVAAPTQPAPQPKPPEPAAPLLPTPVKQAVQAVAQPVLPPELDKALAGDAATKPEQTPAAAPAATGPQSAPEAHAPKLDAPDAKIVEYVQSVQVRGVGKAKVLLLLPGHDEAKAYYAGDMLDSGYELQLLSIGPRRLVITDAQGRKYFKAL